MNNSPHRIFLADVVYHKGYFSFEECGDVVNPTIVLELGETYTFIQRHRSNYYHPMGFAYFPDGAHDDKEELEPGVGLGHDPSCATDKTCPAPMYFLNGEYLGEFSNISNQTTNNWNRKLWIG
jgi:hypothetical protein